MVLQSIIPPSRGAMAKARPSSMHCRALPTKVTKPHMNKGPLYHSYIPAWHSAGVHLARRSDVSKYSVQRPVILHAYGGAKVHMESALQTLRLQGWIPITSALVGTVKKPPAWTTNDLRGTAGTSIDLSIGPTPLTPKEDLLLLSLWRRQYQVPKGCALGTWLTGVNKELGPNNRDSPHQPGCPQNIVSCSVAGFCPPWPVCCHRT